MPLTTSKSRPRNPCWLMATSNSSTFFQSLITRFCRGKYFEYPPVRFSTLEARSWSRSGRRPKKNTLGPTVSAAYTLIPNSTATRVARTATTQDDDRRTNVRGQLRFGFAAVSLIPVRKRLDETNAPFLFLPCGDQPIALHSEVIDCGPVSFSAQHDLHGHR